MGRDGNGNGNGNGDARVCDEAQGVRPTFMFKLILVGDSGVGKSCLLRAYRGGSFLCDMDSTIGVDFAAQKVWLDEKRVVKVQVWDTAGHERFRSITRTYYRDAAGCMLVYDATQPQTRRNLEGWRAAVREVSPDAVFVCVGTKSDLVSVVSQESDSDAVSESDAVVSQSESDALLCSAKSGDGVHMAFGALVRKVYEERARPALERLDAERPKAAGGRFRLTEGIVYYPEATAAVAALESAESDAKGSTTSCPGCAIL